MYNRRNRKEGMREEVGGELTFTQVRAELCFDSV